MSEQIEQKDIDCPFAQPPGPKSGRIRCWTDNKRCVLQVGPICNHKRMIDEWCEAKARQLATER